MQNIFTKMPVKMLKQSSLCKLLTNCTINGTRNSNKNVKVIQYITKNSQAVVIAGPVVLRLQSGAIFTIKVK